MRCQQLPDGTFTCQIQNNPPESSSEDDGDSGILHRIGGFLGRVGGAVLEGAGAVANAFLGGLASASGLSKPIMITNLTPDHSIHLQHTPRRGFEAIQTSLPVFESALSPSRFQIFRPSRPVLKALKGLENKTR